MFNTILMALKFAPASEFALAKGVELARIHNADLHIFHAMDHKLAELEEYDPKLIEEKTKAENYYLASIKPLVETLGKATFKCMPAAQISNKFGHGTRCCCLIDEGGPGSVRRYFLQGPLLPRQNEPYISFKVIMVYYNLKISLNIPNGGFDSYCLVIPGLTRGSPCSPRRESRFFL